MNKQKQIKKRTWKYFREQKWKEVKEFFEENWVPLCVISIISGVMLQSAWAPCKFGETGACYPIIAIIGLCIIGFWALVGIIALIKVIAKWLKSNYKEARKKAEKDFK